MRKFNPPPLPSWHPTPRPGKPGRKAKERARTNAQLCEELLRYMRSGMPATMATRKVGMSRPWLLNMRRRSPTFARLVAVLDRIARDIRPTEVKLMRRGLVTAEKLKPITRRGTMKEEGIFTPRKRAKMMEEAVRLEEKEAFLTIYRETGDRNEALDKMNLKALDVEEALKEDSEFEEKYKEEQLRRFWKVEDEQMKRAETSGVEARAVLKRKGDLSKGPSRGSGNRQLPSWADQKKLEEAEGWAKGEVGFAGKAPS